MTTYEVDIHVSYRQTRTVNSDTVEGAAKTARDSVVREADDKDLNLVEIEVTEVRKNGVPA